MKEPSSLTDLQVAISSTAHDEALAAGNHSACVSAIALTGDKRGWFAVFSDLFKLRLTSLALLTTMAGFYLGSDRSINWFIVLNTLLGTALVAAGASALNQWMEPQFDAQMRRTQNRPLPTGRMESGTVLLIGWLTAILGILELGTCVNWLAALVGAATLFLYVYVYTPLKRRTWLNTIAGAVPGALPPVLGWAAATGQISRETLVLFTLQICWQVPHFMAIAWIYRLEYAKAGFKMLPVIDSTGTRSARQALIFTLALFAISIIPYTDHSEGLIYFIGSAILNAGFVWMAVGFTRELTVPRAKHLFLFSILYLPLLFVLLVSDKLK